MQNTEQILRNLFEEHFQEQVQNLQPIAPSGSARRYFRLTNDKRSVIGSYGNNVQENRAFFAYSRHFKNANLNVPEIYAVSKNELYYLQEDLGKNSLYSMLPQRWEDFSPALVEWYKKALTYLAQMQVEGHKGLDYAVAFPRADFDKQSILWDCNYFKYYFLNPAEVPYDEELLQEEFSQLADYLLEGDNNYFLFRDFQSRNIIINEGECYFIDYQGGRRGAMQYDVASLLYQAKANIPKDLREELLNHYIEEAKKWTKFNETEFRERFYAFVLVRQLQVLGAYGRRGLMERKEHFLKSIPYALENVEYLLKERKPFVHLPELENVLTKLVGQGKFKHYDISQNIGKQLEVKVQSFSYKKSGIPKDPNGNGGGFVFDVRFLHNPGRYEPYKKMSGLDESVIAFLKNKTTIDAFLQDVYNVIDPAIENYLERDFNSLMISFGCTGGQHRSVYCAEAVAAHIYEKYSIRVILKHIEKKSWGEGY